MKKLIILLLLTVSISAQSFKVGGNISLKFANTEKTVTGYGFWGDPVIRKAGGSFTAISIYGDLTADFNKYIAAIFELGYTIGTQTSEEYSGVDVGLYYSTNYLLEEVYLKPGIYAHVNIPNNPHYTTKTIIISSLGGGIRLFENAYLEGAYQIPITKSYVREDSRDIHNELNGMYSVGIKLVF